MQIGILARLLSADRIESLRERNIRRKLHDIKKQEISPGEGMDRTYRKKFLVRSSRDACSVFGSPYSPLQKFEMRREE